MKKLHLKKGSRGIAALFVALVLLSFLTAQVFAAEENGAADGTEPAQTVPAQTDEEKNATEPEQEKNKEVTLRSNLNKRFFYIGKPTEFTCTVKNAKDKVVLFWECSEPDKVESIEVCERETKKWKAFPEGQALEPGEVPGTLRITFSETGDYTLRFGVKDAASGKELSVIETELTVKREFFVVFRALNQGFLQTLRLFAVTLIGAMPLGLLISLGSVSRFKPLSAFTRTLVWIVRGSPLMIQLIIVYYLPGILFDHNLWGGDESGRFWAASVAFILNYACYFSEIFRSGIQAVPHGQQEAGEVLGMTNPQIFFKVKLLQIIKHIIPPMSNEIITLVKDTSLARIIALQEIIWAGQGFMKGSEGISGVIWPLFFTAVYYLLFSGILTVLFNRLEKKLSYFKA